MVTTAQERPLADAADVSSGDDADVPSPDPVSAARSRHRCRAYIGSAAVAAAFVCTFGINGYLGWQLWQQHTQAESESTARQAAVQYAQVLTSIDSGHVDDNFAAVLNGATGEFKDMYTKSSLQLRQLLIDNKATANGVVVESAIQSATRDRAVVLLMVDQTVTNTARPDPRVDRSRMKMTMELVDGRWLAAKVELP
ncbi:Mce protein [Mycolicibacterium cosmeticum]|uniref:Mce protein n=1 Tax=Mycolicibacterium cosmeticum TaxID=258533 RepID=UPI003204BABF